MKKNICILFANIIILLTMLMLANFYIEKNILKDSFDSKLGFNRFFYNNLVNSNVNIENIPHEPTLVKKIPITENTFFEYCGENRIVNKTDNDTKPIIVLGCSYAYGHGLKKEDSFANILSKITNRSVYNYSSCGATLFDSLYSFLRNSEKIAKTADVEDVIYIYMHDHINRNLQIKRLYSYYDELFDSSENKIHNFLLNKFPLYKFICCLLQLKKILKEFPNTEKMQEFLKKSVLIAYKKIKTQYPNAKLIIILYEEKIPDRRSSFEILYVYEFINSKIWDELQEETNGNIKIVRTKEVMGFYFDKNYKLKEDISEWHPNSRVWREFTPKFVSQYIK